MAISIVQSKQPTIFSGSGGAGTGAFTGAAADITFPGATTTGNTIVVLVPVYMSGGPSAATVGITDNKGNTYTRAGRGLRNSNNDGAEIWYCVNATGGPSHTVSVIAATGSLGSLYGELIIYELSAVDTTTPISIIRAGGDGTSLPANNGTVTFDGASTSTATLPSITAPYADCFWAVIVAPGGAPGFNGTPPGYISGGGLTSSYYSDYATSNNAVWGAGIIAGSAAQTFVAIAGNGNIGTDQTGWIVVAFKPAAAAISPRLTTLFCG